MSIMEKLAAQRAKIAAMKETLADEPVVEVPAGWKATGRTKRGKPVYEVYATFVKRNPILDILGGLPTETGEHIEGGICPHCKGAGRYAWHTQAKREKCYRCHGKGHLDRKDLAYLKRREVNKEPICKVVTA